MLHRVGIGIGSWLSLRRAGTFWLDICVRGGTFLLAVGRLRRVIHREGDEKSCAGISMRLGGLKGTRVVKQPPKRGSMLEKESNNAQVG